MGCVPEKNINKHTADNSPSFTTSNQNNIQTEKQEKQENPVIVCFLLIYSSLKKLKKKLLSYLD